MRIGSEIVTVVFVLCFGSILAAQDLAPPRETFERAAYAEEHERDFEKALGLYREAGSVANFLGDATLAAEALKAVKRLEARSGKGAETVPVGQEVPMAVRRRLYLLISDLCAPVIGENRDAAKWQIAKQVAAFGPVAVPMLDTALQAETVADPEALERRKESQAFPPFRPDASREPAVGIRGDSVWAARALGEIADPSATAALLRGLRSQDPVVRVAVLEANPKNHRPLFAEAAGSADEKVVSQALTQLARVNDPALYDLMMAALARPGREARSAAQWIVRQRPEVIESLLRRAEGVSEEALYGLLDGLVESKSPAAPKIVTLLDAADGAKDSTRRAVILSKLTGGRIAKSAFTDDQCARVEALALSELGGSAPKSAMGILREFGGIKSAEAIAAMLDAGTLPPDEMRGAAQFVNHQVGKMAPEQFGAAAKLARIVAVRVPDERSNAFGSLRSVVKRGTVKDEDVVLAYSALPADVRVAFLRSVLSYFEYPPVALLKEAYRVDREQRHNALSKMNQIGDPACIPEAVDALGDDQENARALGDALLGAIVLNDEATGWPVLSRLLGELPPDRIRYVTRAARAVPPAKVAARAEELLAAGGAPERREELVELVLSLAHTPETLGFMVKHFASLNDTLKARSIAAFKNTLHEPAIDLIGVALKDNSAKVRDAAREALFAFREHREALEEFKRWKTGDSEARASISELVALLESKDQDVVQGAVRALGALKAKAALPSLVKLLARDDKDLKAAVNDAITKIGEGGE